MKGHPPLFGRFLLAAIIVAAVTLPAQAADGNPDTAGGILSGITEGLSHPLTSVCSSPVFHLYVTFIDPNAKSNDLDHCIQFVAVQTGDTSECPGIQRGAPMTKCYLLIAAKKNDPSICDQIPATPDMQAYLPLDCRWEVAMKNNNAGACEEMEDQKISRMFIGEMSRETCLSRLASGQGATGALT